jgi:hypothetical protein
MKPGPAGPNAYQVQPRLPSEEYPQAAQKMVSPISTNASSRRQTGHRVELAASSDGAAAPKDIARVKPSGSSGGCDRSAFDGMGQVISARISFRTTLLPGLTCSALKTPEIGAMISFSIFMASNTSMDCPAAT